MRLGISSKELGGSPTAWAKRLKDIGCGSVVFPVNHTESDALIAEYAKAIKNEGLTLAEVGIWKNMLAVNEEDRLEAMKYSIGQLQLADELGANCCVNIAGAVGEYWAGAYKGNYSKETWNRTVKWIQEVIDAVNPKNTYFTIEPMPYMIPMNPDQYLELMEAVDREAFAVHLDVFNWISDAEKYFFNEDFMEECFEKLGPYIKSCHLKDVMISHAPTCQLIEVACGEGEINLEKYAQLAEKCDADIPMIIEHLKTDQAYLESLAYVSKRLRAAGIILR